MNRRQFLKSAGAAFAVAAGVAPTLLAASTPVIDQAERYIGIDYGFKDITAVIAVTHRGIIYVEDGVYIDVEHITAEQIRKYGIHARP